MTPTPKDETADALRPYDSRIIDLAKIAALAAAKNARVAPQLLMADITFTLVDAVEDGRIALPALSDRAAEREGEKINRDYTRQRIGELIDEGDGDWTACSGCQEGIDGCVSTTDYPYDPMFRCQPGGGCGECGGIGVIWRDRSYYQMDEGGFDTTPDTLHELREARTSLSIIRTQIMVEIGRGRDQWDGVPEALKTRLDAIDAALATTLRTERDALSLRLEAVEGAFTRFIDIMTRFQGSGRPNIIHDAIIEARAALATTGGAK